MSLAAHTLSQSENVKPTVESARNKAVRLRCMVYKHGNGGYVAECIDLDLMACGKTAEKAIASLGEALSGYLEVALSDDPRGLVPRPSPIGHHIRYKVFAMLALIKRTHRNFQLFNWPPRPSYCS